MENPSGQVLVIFGASGDLAKRKLLPALFALHCEGFLPKNFAIVGVGRTEMNSESVSMEISPSKGYFAY